MIKEYIYDVIEVKRVSVSAKSEEEAKELIENGSYIECYGTLKDIELIDKYEEEPDMFNLKEEK